MWILINNRPVCVFDIKNVTVIMKLTPEAFYQDNKIRGGLLRTINQITAELPKVTI